MKSPDEMSRREAVGLFSALPLALTLGWTPAFFNSFRDLTASGFWSSEMGVKDLQYRGNAFVPEWTGCPDAALRKIGVRYD